MIRPNIPLKGLGMLLLMLGLWQSAAAQRIKVVATVNETTIGVQETLLYTVEVQGSTLPRLADPSPPETEGLVLVQPIPFRRSSFTSINGRMEQSMAYQWTFQPVREGEAVIKRTQVQVGEETFQTEPIRVKVVAQTQRPAPTRRNPLGSLDPFSSGEVETAEPTAQDLFIRVVPSARRAYQNQQVTVEYQLFFREGIQLRQSRLTDSWDAEGFWREELDVETRPIPRAVVENGLRYNTIVLKRAAVFPTRAGALRVDPLRIETEAILPSRNRDPFERFFSRRSRYTPVEVASPPLTVDARPLPNGAPETFNGAVGQFRMLTQLDRTSVEVGESVQLRVTVSGTGNIATLEMPDLDPPSIFEQYDPQIALSIDRSGNRIRGTKKFTYILVPRSNGTFTLPPLVFSYFDNQSGSYRTLRSDAHTIRVTGTATTPLPARAPAAGLPGDDIAGTLGGTPAWVRTGQSPLHRSPWVYALLLVPVLALVGLYGYQRYATRLATDQSYARNRRAHPLARKHLKQAGVLLKENKPGEFYEEVERAVMGFVGNRLNIAELGLTRTQLDDRLAISGVTNATRADLLHLLEECDRMRFAPMLPDQATMDAALDRAARLVVMLDEQFKAYESMEA